MRQQLYNVEVVGGIFEEDDFGNLYLTGAHVYHDCEVALDVVDLIKRLFPRADFENGEITCIENIFTFKDILPCLENK